MQCPESKLDHIHKNGRKRGKQNYICVNCRRHFLACYQEDKGYSGVDHLLIHYLRFWDVPVPSTTNPPSQRSPYF